MVKPKKLAWEFYQKNPNPLGLGVVKADLINGKAVENLTYQ